MLARVPILAWALLLAGACWGSKNSYFGGLFEITEDTGLFWVSLTALLVTLGMLAAANLVIEHGTERIQQHDTPVGYVIYSPSPWVFLIGILPAIAVMLVVFRISAILDPASDTLEILGGYLVAFLVFLLAQVVQFLTADLDPHKTPNFLIYPLEKVLVLRWILLLAYIHQGKFSNWVRGGLNRLAQIVIAHVPGRGYIYKTPQWAPAPGEPRFYDGHLFSLGLATASFLLWIILGAVKQKNIGAPSGQMPSLAYVLLAVMVLVWLLSTLAFFLDRWRVPVLLVIVAWGLLVGRSTETDHYFRLVMDSQHPVSFPTPASVLASRPRPVVIATAGGGIQAGAWTTEVVEQLQKETGSLVDNIALMSSVSGGSLGSLYVGQALYQLLPSPAMHPDLIPKLRRASDSARVSSLDEVAWGMANPDLWRTLFPIVSDPVVDRGWALERSWEERSDSQEVYLSDWAAAAGQKRLPAFIFNSTVIETGSPIVLTNTSFPGSGDALATARHLRNTQQVLGVDAKIRVATAARLSATFPYVSPAARGYPSPALHLVDGGYYDNFGIATGLIWLDEAISGAPAGPPRDVAVVQIRPSDLDDDSAGTVTGWWYQVAAPIDGILGVRNNDQFRADAALYNLLQEKWASKGIQVCSFQFVYPRNAPPGCNHQPMSWKLTQVQSQCIPDTWQAEMSKRDSDIYRDVQRLKKFLENGTCPKDTLDEKVHAP